MSDMTVGDYLVERLYQWACGASMVIPATASTACSVR